MVYIPLVNRDGKIIGKSEKLEAHKNGNLHLAFSIIILNNNKEMLIHKRNINKYHSGGLWTNACCSHPNYDEKLDEAVHRRLKEEMGFDTELEKIFDFKYKKKFENGLIENEFDNVYIGYYDGDIHPDDDEVEDYKWMKINELMNDYKNNPDKYTEWFKIILKKIAENNFHDL